MIKESKNAQWFLVNTYSGSEKKAKLNLEERIKGYGLEDRILKVILPVDYYSVVERGKRKIKTQRVFPGYIVVNMILDDQTWFVVRNTPGVLGFVGSGGKPTPLTEEEVQKLFDRIGEDEAREKMNFEVGNRVKILAGPFKDMEGTVQEIDVEKGKSKILLEMFGREMPVEIKSEFIQKI
ncbi:MAG: transcription termination/antitermination factor NusG [Nitrospiraceae bacterium]|nr:transcription termination/antitermination factor NusG [Nitrospiraceae bacterium]